MKDGGPSDTAGWRELLPDGLNRYRNLISKGRTRKLFSIQSLPSKSPTSSCTALHSGLKLLGARHPSRRVAREHKVPGLRRFMTRKARLGHRLVRRFVTGELSESPTPGRGIPSRVLDHELNIRRRSGNERLFPSKGFVVLLRRNVPPGQPRNHGSVRKGKRSFPIGLDRNVVPQDGAKIIQVARLVRHGDQSPIAVPGRNLDHRGRNSLSVSLSRSADRESGHAPSHYCNGYQQESDSFDGRPPSNSFIRPFACTRLDQGCHPPSPISEDDRLPDVYCGSSLPACSATI